MRVTVVGATGNVGTSLLSALAEDPQITSIVGVARRRPALTAAKTAWVQADIVKDDLSRIFSGSDVIVHLAWLIQPSHQRSVTRQVNQLGSKRVFDAAAGAGARALVYASSVGAYSPGPKDYGVDESWPTDGISTSFYSVDKAATERMLDAFEVKHPDIRVVRLRPGLIFKREAGAEVRRLFAGPFFPGLLVHPHAIRLIPDMPSLRFQCVHSYDVGEAYRLAITTDARGAFNIAADPVLDPAELAEAFGARLVRVSPRLLRNLAHWSWRSHLQPTPAGWIDLALRTPLLDTKRARHDLGWRPRRSSKEALFDLLTGLREGAGLNTPPLRPRAGGTMRIREFLSGIGQRTGLNRGEVR